MEMGGKQVKREGEKKKGAQKWVFKKNNARGTARAERVPAEEQCDTSETEN